MTTSSVADERSSSSSGSDSSSSALPGQQIQTVSGREDDGMPTGVLIVVVIFVLILILAITCGILRLCKKEERIEGGPSYSVAISNRLFKERRQKKNPRPLREIFFLLFFAFSVPWNFYGGGLMALLGQFEGSGMYVLLFTWPCAAVNKV